jgi:VCBS repeat-containing protein
MTNLNGWTIITHLFAVLLILAGMFVQAFTVLAYNPTADNTTYHIEVDTTLHEIAVAGVLANDTDADNDTISAILVTDVSNGTLMLNSDGSFTYAHDGSQSLSDNFIYQALDGVDYSNMATVSITIDPAWPTNGWISATPAEMGLDQAKLEEACDYALTGAGSGFITRGGKLVMSWGSLSQLYDLKSTTKSIGVTILGLAMADGVVDVNDPAQIHLPGIGVPPDAYWSWGLYESFIIVIPSLDIVAARAGDSWRVGWDGDYAIVEPFIKPIVQSVFCISDFEPDGDVDGSDLAEYNNDGRGIALIHFAYEFGRVDCN